MKYTLRDYQQAASDAAIRFFGTKSQKNGILVLPTGAGKSLVIADIAHRLDGNILVFQPSKEILEQNFAKLKSYGEEDCSIYSASFNSKKISRITFATIGSVKSHKEDFNHFHYIIVDECFPYGQFISTEWGPKRIGHLYNLYKNGDSLPKVESFDERNGKIVLKPITNVMFNGEKPTTVLHFSGNKRIISTYNHPFLTKDGWKQASELKVGDIVLTTGHSHSDLRIPNADQYDLLIGSILGDGSVDKRPNSNMYRIRFIHGEAQKEYIKWKADLLGCTVKKIENNGISSKIAYRFNSPVMPLKDSEITKEYAIENLTPKSLAILFMDDGHLDKLENQGTICTVADSEILTQRLCDKLRKTFGIDCCACRAESSYSHKSYYYIRLRKKGVETLSELIAPYIHPSMSYKINKANKHKCGSYLWNDQYSNLRGIVFQRREEGSSVPVYNMEVQDTHTYILHTGKYDKEKKSITHGIVVHNCHGVNPQGGMYKDFFDCAKRKILGLTATPYRLFAAIQYQDSEENVVYRPKEPPVNPALEDLAIKVEKRERMISNPQLFRNAPVPDPVAMTPALQEYINQKKDYVNRSIEFEYNLEQGSIISQNVCILKFLTRMRPRVFHDVIYKVEIQTLLERGYLAKLNYYDLTILPQDGLKRNTTGMDFDDKNLFNEFQRVNLQEHLVDIIKRLQKPKSGIPRKGILVFTKFLEESKRLCEAIEGCAMLSGSTPKKERKRIIDDFKSGKIKVLANVGVLTTGFDYPELDTVVMARPTMSLAMYYQILGRAIRPHLEKEAGWIIDLCGNYRRFGRVEDLRLFELNPGEYIIQGIVDKQTKQLTNCYF